jgi:hypothetical protein
MKKSPIAKHKVTPFNIRNGAKAPSFIVEVDNKAKREDIAKAAEAEFSSRSALAKYQDWNIETEKV